MPTPEKKTFGRLVPPAVAAAPLTSPSEVSGLSAPAAPADAAGGRGNYHWYDSLRARPMLEGLEKADLSIMRRIAALGPDSLVWVPATDAAITVFDRLERLCKAAVERDAGITFDEAQAIDAANDPKGQPFTRRYMAVWRETPDLQDALNSVFGNPNHWGPSLDNALAHWRGEVAAECRAA